MSAKCEALTSSSTDSEEERIREKLRKEQKKSKKRKQHKSATAEQEQPPKRIAKVHKEESKPTPPQKPQQSSEGDQRILIGRMKFVTVREFRNKPYIDIREFYEKDGDFLPGKKGISLTPEQWQTLKEKIEEIDENLHRIC